MFIHFFRKHVKMILTGVFFFYLGCGVTLSVLRVDCVDAIGSSNIHSESTLSNVEYAVLILTSPGNEEKRNAVRATWGKFPSNIITENGERLYKWNYTWVGEQTQPEYVKFFFVVGIQGLDTTVITKLENENARNNDILMLHSFQDTYKNLAVKLLHSLKWLKENLEGLKYVIKCDDDSFVRIDLMIRDLEAFAPDMNAGEISEFVTYKTSLPTYKGLYWGYFDGRARVYLNGKWQEQDWFLCDNYLPYALGGGYVISRSIVDFIGRNFDNLSHYKSEDVSMGVWTSALDGINRVHDIRFDTQWTSRGCNTDMIVRHKQLPKDMFEMYRTLVHSKGEKLCKTESIERRSYSYKWNVLPSMCCR